MSIVTIASSSIEDRGYCQTVNDIEFMLPGSYARFKLGWSPQGVPARKAPDGPMTDELFGWLNEQATVIAAVPLPQTPTVAVDFGDVIEVEGVGRFLIGSPVYRYDHRPTITVVEG